MSFMLVVVVLGALGGVSLIGLLVLWLTRDRGGPRDR